MYHTPRFCASFFVAAFLASVTCSVVASAERFAIGVDKDVVYGVGAAPGLAEGQVCLLMDVYYPEKHPSAEKPAVLLAHGGGFHALDKEHARQERLARFFAARGYVAFSINYRQVRHQPPAPPEFQDRPVHAAQYAAVSDAKAAVRWMRAHHERYGVAKDKIFAMGSSAGATTVLGVALTRPLAWSFTGHGDRFQLQNNPGESPSVRAAVALWGNGDFYLDQINATAPPVLIVHGKHDPKADTPFEAAERLVAALRAASAPHRHYFIDRPGHTFWRIKLEGKGLAELALAFFEDTLEK